jgi:2-desacetyl-2-hydroxyethyl bacteriochlorophyllide A dehydrogenase
MKALVYTGEYQLETREEPVPAANEGEALIRIASAGICGSDISIWKGLHPRAKAPLIMGHEFSGTIEEINAPSDSGFKKGDRVTAEPLITCGSCIACKSGFSYVCQNLKLYGIDRNGGFAEYVALPLSKLYPIPDSVDLETGALIEPLAVAVHAVRLSNLKFQDIVCVFGGGPIGLLTALVARECGPQKVLVFEKEPFRIDMARQFGLEVVDVNSCDPEDAVAEASKGRGADIVFEAAGAEASIGAAVRSCRVRGEMIQVAMPKKPVPFDIVALTFKEVIVKGVRVYAPFDFERAIKMIASSSIDFSAMITNRYSLDEGVEAFKRASEGKNVMRVLFTIT